MQPKRILLAMTVSLAACGGSPDSPSTPAASPAETPAATEGSQIEFGAALFAEYCASCHGADAKGTDNAPALVGPDALPLRAPEGRSRDLPFHTAGDVFRFMSTAMPANDPGSLSAEQYAAILTFALHANGVEVSEMPLNEAQADQITLH